jgi:hypothetical protein
MLSLLLAATLALPTASDTVASRAPRDVFWARLQTLCESAAAGRLVQAPPGDTQIDPTARLVVHLWECSDTELRFPLHVTENRSRTWVFIRHADQLELRHDHRHEDGTEDRTTWYGATTLDAGSDSSQAFVTERNGVRSGWRVEVVPGVRFTYGTIRGDAWRHHLEFDLRAPVPTPPLHWGHDVRPSQRPSRASSARP